MGDTMPHRIQVFTGGCELCRQTVDIVELGKCKGCKMDVMPIDAEGSKDLVNRYGINAVSSIVIGGRIKVVGKPMFPWYCGEEFYRKLEKEFPLRSD
ncbi:MAG: thioredoxin family protein [Nitrososphaerota archaeon]|nr:thioredoxin family protein [Nitrososphaerota archaeon]MDG6917556.1 thioredoxin family protein [Nitrososphaerota archaeon]MDG6919505.1 thioredoxin family protein [Nitrososphaerota archaeon]MDG6946733.1 thioredoxin family protein [Nitrososphaerota archaeon]